MPPLFPHLFPPFLLLFRLIHKTKTNTHTVYCQWNGDKAGGLCECLAQANLDRDVYVEIPKCCGHLNEGMDCVLKLNKSLYEMSDAPQMFFELLKKNLNEVGFQQFTHIDPCLFVHKHAICSTYRMIAFGLARMVQPLTG